jgi:hypothetical protein
MALAHAAAQVEDHLQPEHHARQPHVQSRVAFAQVAELVRHQALQFVARQVVQRAARDGDHRVVLAQPAAKALMPSSRSSTMAWGGFMLAAMASSLTMLHSFCSASRLAGQASRAPARRASASPPPAQR